MKNKYVKTPSPQMEEDDGRSWLISGDEGEGRHFVAICTCLLYCVVCHAFPIPACQHAFANPTLSLPSMPCIWEFILPGRHFISGKTTFIFYHFSLFTFCCFNPNNLPTPTCTHPPSSSTSLTGRREDLRQDISLYSPIGLK